MAKITDKITMVYYCGHFGSVLVPFPILLVYFAKLSQPRDSKMTFAVFESTSLTTQSWRQSHQVPSPRTQQANLHTLHYLFNAER